jgi:hypothetical protein
MPTFPGPIPETDAQLHDFIARWVGIESPRTPILEQHTAPFDYLAHAFFEDRRPRDAVVWACRGGGKTFLAALATALDMIFKPGIEIRCLGGSLDQSKRMHAHLRDLFERPGFASMLDKVTERRITLTNESHAEILAQSQTSVRGTRVQKLRCDEVELFHPAVWEAAQLTTRSKECGSVRVVGAIECLSTMHIPYGLMHDLAASCRAEPGQRPPRRLFRWGVVDVLSACPDDDHQCLTDEGPCPLAPECAGLAKARDRRREPPGHIAVADAINMKARVSAETWNAEMLCLRPRRSDCVLPEFNEADHVVDRPPDASAFWPVIAGMDFGIRAPTVILFARLAPDNRLCVFREHVQPGWRLDQHIDLIRQSRPAPRWIGVDPAGQNRNTQTATSEVQAMRAQGLSVKVVRLPLHAGIELLRARLRPALGPPRLTITRDCPRLIQALTKYHYPDDPHTPNPEKDGNDHPADALRYMIQNLDQPYWSKVDHYTG